jgi:hypothetical protein
MNIIKQEIKIGIWVLSKVTNSMVSGSFTEVVAVAHHLWDFPSLYKDKA